MLLWRKENAYFTWVSIESVYHIIRRLFKSYQENSKQDFKYFPLDVSWIKFFCCYCFFFVFCFFFTLRNMSSDTAVEVIYADVSKMSRSAESCSLYSTRIPVSILYKSIAGRYRLVRVADGPITARYRFIKNASWDGRISIYYLEKECRHFLFIIRGSDNWHLGMLDGVGGVVGSDVVLWVDGKGYLRTSISRSFTVSCTL